MRENSSPVTRTISIEGLSKSFGGHTALKDLDLQITKGECLTVFGPNGAGKTTLIKILSTLSRPSKGNAQLAGLDITREAVRIRKLIGVISHQTFLYDNLSAYENLRFYGKMYDINDLEKRISEVIEQVGLTNRIHDRVGVFSRGMQQRLSIARAILHDPPIMLLDEPETGLDQHATEMLINLLRALTSGDRTVLMTTHNLALGLGLGNRMVILHKGRIAYEDSTENIEPDSLLETYKKCTGAAS